MLGVADVANFAIGHVIPPQRRTEDSRDSHISIGHGFREFVACNRRIVSERGGVAATRGATAACLHVWQYAVKNVVRLESA